MIELLFTLLLLNAAVPASAQIDPGDRVAIVGSTFADQMKRVGYFESMLLIQCPGAVVRNLGWAGDTVDNRARPTNFPKEDATLTEHQTDVMLLCFGLGESLSGKSGLAAFEKDLLALIRHYRDQTYNGDSAPRIILVSPIAAQNLGEGTPRYKEINENLAAYTSSIRGVAKAENLPFVDLFSPTFEHLKENEKVLTVNGLHLNEVGYRWVSRILINRLFPESVPASIELDYKKPSDALKIIGGGVEIAVKDPLIAPPKLTLLNLPWANFTLSLNGQKVVTASSEQWAKGVVLYDLEIPEASEVFRQSVLRKNQDFTFGWKALNQVHIVGERKKSKSGQALPQELVEFDQRTRKQETVLTETTPSSQTHTFRIIATPERKSL